MFFSEYVTRIRVIRIRIHVTFVGLIFSISEAVTFHNVRDNVMKSQL